MKLDQDDATRICERVGNNGMATGLVAEQFEVSRRRVQQLMKKSDFNRQTATDAVEEMLWEFIDRRTLDL